ncbi:MAG: radical SAM protein [Candidatus Aureabacteria bacterium]|nr:radical SAM protein [Candidatus Auribacterota bacterium]
MFDFFNKQYKFSDAIRIIDSADKDLFCLLNLNTFPQNRYFVFNKDNRFILDLLKGTTKFKLFLRHVKDIKELNRLLTDLKKAGFFQPLKLNPVNRSRHKYFNTDSYLKKSRTLIDESKLKFKNSNKENLSWASFYPKTSIKLCSFTISPTNLCNLRCKYCFVTSNSFANPNLDIKSLMSKDASEKIFDKLIEYTKSRFDSKIGGLRIIFYGGMTSSKGKPREALYQMVKYIEKRTFDEDLFVKFSIIDNGVSIDEELIRFYKKHNFSVSLSFDLPKDIQDIHRPMANGNKTGSMLENALKLCKKHKLSTAVQCTISKLNQTRIIEMIDYMISLKQFSLSAFPMSENFRSTNPEISIEPPDMNVLYNEYLHAFEYTKQLYCKKGIQFRFNPITMMIKNIIRGGREQYCGMGRDYFTIDVNGDVHTCYNVRVPEFQITNVIEESDCIDKMLNVGSKFQSKSFSDFFTNTPEDLCLSSKSDMNCNSSFDQCKNCEILIFCSGGCKAHAFAEKGCANMPAPLLNTKDNDCMLNTQLYRKLFWDYILSPIKNKNVMKFYQSIAPQLKKKNPWKAGPSFNKNLIP